jgi:type II secretory pathway component PulL
VRELAPALKSGGLPPRLSAYRRSASQASLRSRVSLLPQFIRAQTTTRRLRFRLRTLLFVVAILALFLVVVTQQVQTRHQQVQIRQMRQEIDRYLINQNKLTARLRALRDHLDRAG